MKLQDGDELSERIFETEMNFNIDDANQPQRNIVGHLHEDQPVCQEVDIECRVAGEEISLHILCIVRQQV